jgi:hypothetical protein
MIRPRPRLDPLAVACVIFVAALAVIFAFLVRRETRLVSLMETEIAPPARAPFPDRYRNEAAQIVGDFLKIQAALPSPNDAAAPALLPPLAEMRRRLLALVVPSGERDLHLRMVTAVSLWEDGVRTGQAELIRNGSGSFSLLLDEFPWLGKGLIDKR